MDRNQIIGLVLIAAMVVGYLWYSAPSQEEIMKRQQHADSVHAAQMEAQRIKDSIQNVQAIEDSLLALETVEDTTLLQEDSSSPVVIANKDSIRKAKLQSHYGIFAEAAEGEEKIITLENNKIRVKISTRGAAIQSVELKEYSTYDSMPLFVMDDSSNFYLQFAMAEKLVSTNNLYFNTETNTDPIVVQEDSATVLFRLPTSSDNAYLEVKYSLKADDYMLGFDLKHQNLGAIFNSQIATLNWDLASPKKEKDIKLEKQYTTIYYQYEDEDDSDDLGIGEEESTEFEYDIHWLSFKQQYFSASVIADESFTRYESKATVKDIHTKKYSKHADIKLGLNFNDQNTSAMQFYFGPNHFNTLNSYDLGLEDQVSLGWLIFGWVNRFLVIPVFNFLDGFNLSYGLIILLLTLFIKTLLLPITYKTYKSSAKMRVLKPEIDELNEKYKDKDALEKQRAQMTLYRKAGVNPMAGCIPQLIQMPILFAMFRFFPASIELRQKSFLWADDLSTWDAIYTWTGDIPLITWALGNHISLFTLLMAASMFLYTRFNTGMTMSSGAQAKQMQVMMYIMPIFMLGFFNNYPAALSYYYFTANVVSMLQQFLIKKFFINEEAIHKQIQENKKKPKKKSKFQARLEEMQKQRMQGAQPGRRGRRK